MGQFTVRHVIETDADTFWGELFFDEPFNRKLYLEGLGFESYEVLESREESDGTLVRRVRTVPRVAAPSVVTKLVGDNIGYVEKGRYDKQARKYRFTVEPSKMADKIDTHGELWVEARGDKKIERIVSTHCDVKIFGVGRAVEGFIEKTTRDSYEKAAAFTNKYLREKKL